MGSPSETRGSSISRLDFGREVCGHLPVAERREWLVTNGIGGYACGTVAGTLTRRYHGLLVAALDPPLGRRLLLVKLDETASYAGRGYPLFVNRWAGGEVQPSGYHHLERFRLEGTVPLWTYACADALIEKRVWMEPGANTTYVRYDLVRASSPVTLSIKAVVDHRSHHATTRAGEQVLTSDPVEQGLRVTAADVSTPIYVLSSSADAAAEHTWFRDYLLAAEDYRGRQAEEDHLYAGRLEAELSSGETLTIVASAQAGPSLDGGAAWERRQGYEQQLLERSDANLSQDRHPSAPEWVRHLVLSADQFIVRRSPPEEPEGSTILAGYPWFGDWGRDTMISLPGLTLVTGRYSVAERILRTFAHLTDQGMIPNRFPKAGAPPDYNTVDATLWYVEAIRAYWIATDDVALLRDLFPVLREIIDWHVRGTRYHIHVDPDDGLLYAGEEGVQLTWMDAKVDDWVVTPRVGKPVEVNALWYNAVCTMIDVARRLGEPVDRYEAMAQRTRSGFDRFWKADVGYCYDVLDGPEGHDAALRPNQLLAVSLPRSPLGREQQRTVVQVCARHLLTSYGLRSLSPGSPGYTGHYGGDRRERDAAYHQGTVWSWLIGPFIRASLRVYGDSEEARTLLQPFVHHLADHGVGSVSEIFDGDPPFAPRGCTAQAWSVAQLLETWHALRNWSSDGGKGDR